MPAAATLNSGFSTLAFTVPVGARGFVVWNNSATELRLRINAKAAASGADEGIPIAAGDSGTVFYTHGFSQPLKEPVNVYIYQASGSALTSGVGWDKTDY